jgi:Uma2 family endonuclease
VILSKWSEPEPDVSIVLGGPFDYLPEHPKAADVRLLIEVADTTLRFDRGRKRSAYARSDIPEYWIVNLPARQLEVYRDPVGSRYRSVTVHSEHEAVTPLAAPHAFVRVSDLLPPLPAPERD